MKTLYPALLAFSLALSACANDANSNASAATSVAPAPAPAAPVAAPPATPAEAPAADAAPATTDAMAGMSAKDHAAMANKTASAQPAPAGSVQAGWYTAGVFRACGSTQAMKVDKPAAIDLQIKKGGLSAGDPVYVQLEGMPMGDSYMLTRVAQVGSKAPVRDCPMTGTTTQSGG